MARGGFLGRIGRAIKNIIAPSPPPRREAPPPEPPREPPRRDRISAEREIWREYRGGKNLNKHLALFHSLIDPIEDDPNERLEIWESYVRNMVKGEGQFRRNSSQNMFWRDSGLDPDPDVFNWARWREAMGFVGKRRSRTP